MISDKLNELYSVSTKKRLPHKYNGVAFEIYLANITEIFYNRI